MKTSKKLGILILIIIVVFQFVQPMRNVSSGLNENDISNVYPMSDQLRTMFQQKCYDCHSNNTRYPWYVNVQPIGWWLAAHVHEGKTELNFSEFKNYPADKRAHKLEEIGEVTEEGSMPLKAYTIFHEGSELTSADKEAIDKWLKEIANR
jgi:hypothetical protein